MILPTMTDDDKCFEAFRTCSWIYSIMQDMAAEVTRKLKTRTHFPTFVREDAMDDKNNKWRLLFFVPNKATKKKKKYGTMCYTIYENPPKHKENDTNAGKGIIMYDPYQMHHYLANKDKEDVRMACFMDIIPHAIHRYTERYLKPNGLENISFDKKVESILGRILHFDVSADIHGDVSAKNNLRDSLCSYDFVMRGGGLLRGQMISSFLIRFFTYVSKDMMYDNQLERQEEMNKEYWQWKRKGFIP